MRTCCSRTVMVKKLLLEYRYSSKIKVECEFHFAITIMSSYQKRLSGRNPSIHPSTPEPLAACCAGERSPDLRGTSTQQTYDTRARHVSTEQSATDPHTSTPVTHTHQEHLCFTQTSYCYSKIKLLIKKSLVIQNLYQPTYFADNKYNCFNIIQLHS